MRALDLLNQRVDAMDTLLHRQYEYKISSSRASVLSTGLFKMEQQINKIKPLKSSKSLMMAVSSDNPLLKSALSCVPEEAVSSLAMLKDRFVSLERRAREADLWEIGGSSSMLSVLFGFLFSGLLVSEHHLDIDSSNQSRLSRAGWYLDRDDLLGCALELSQLNGPSRDVCSVWLNDAKGLLAARRATKLVASDLIRIDDVE